MAATRTGGNTAPGELRARQRAMILDMLQHATMPDAPDLDSGDAPWKILIFDTVGRDVLGPIVKLKELREAGVTLHLPLDSSRQPIPGVPAIYFCAPTAANVARIAADCLADLYQHVYVNFTAQVNRALLESLAEQLQGLPNVNHIHVFDRTLSYIALANDLFTLTHQDTFRALNSRNATEEGIEHTLSSIAHGLTHVYLSTQALPIVAYVRSGPAQELADRVVRQLADLVHEGLLTPAATAPRPLLLLVDRGHDLSAPLHHPFSYRGLLADALGMTLNKVEVTNAQGQRKVLELDPDHDTFWTDNAVQRFSEVGSNCDAALAAYKKEYQALTAAEGLTSSEANSADTVTKMLAVAPKLAERKRCIDAHMTIAYAALQQIKKRELDAYNGVEEALLRREELDRESFERLLAAAESSKTCGTQADKDRLYLLAHLLSEDEQATFVEQHVGAAQGPERPSIPALNYVKSLRSWSVPGASPTTQANAADASGWKFASNLTKNFTKAFTATSQDVVLPLTRIVDAVAGPQQAQRPARERSKALEAVVAQDPRNPGAAVDLTTVRAPSVCVFLIGGGSMCEYDNIKQWEPVPGFATYGCTEMLSGDAFLKQLHELGGEASA